MLRKHFGECLPLGKEREENEAGEGGNKQVFDVGG